jgi:hypothetical protein
MLKLSPHHLTLLNVNTLCKPRYFHAAFAARNDNITKASTDPKHDGTEISDTEWNIRAGEQHNLL